MRERENKRISDRCAADKIQQLCDAIVSILTKISEECFKHFLESMSQRIKEFLEATGI